MFYYFTMDVHSIRQCSKNGAMITLLDSIATAAPARRRSLRASYPLLPGLHSPYARQTPHRRRGARCVGTTAALNVHRTCRLVEYLILCRPSKLNWLVEFGPGCTAPGALAAARAKTSHHSHCHHHHPYHPPLFVVESTTSGGACPVRAHSVPRLRGFPGAAGARTRRADRGSQCHASRTDRFPSSCPLGGNRGTAW